MPAKSNDLEKTVAQAAEQESMYDWTGAAELYNKALSLTGDFDFSALADKYERIGYTTYRFSMQSETKNEFGANCAKAIDNYRKAVGLYNKGSEQMDKAKSIRCKAMITYLRFWQATDPAEKRKLIEDCWILTKRSLRNLENLGSNFEYGKTFNQLSPSIYFFYALEWNADKYEAAIKEGVECGEKAIAALLNVDKVELAKSYVMTNHVLFGLGYLFVPCIDEKLRLFQKGKDYVDRAISLSVKHALLALLSIPNAPFDDIKEIKLYYEKALEFAKETRDKLLIGTAMDVLAYAYCWESLSMDSPVEKVNTANRALQMIDDSKQLFSPFSYVSPRGGAFWTGQAHAEYHLELALYETDLKKRRDLLEKAAIEGGEAVRLAEKTGYHEVVMNSNNILSRVLASLAHIETTPEQKLKLLDTALEYREKTVRLTEKSQPFAYWDAGVMYNYLADLKSEIAGFLNDIEKKKAMLTGAILNKEKALELCIKETSLWEEKGVPHMLPMLGRYQYSFGEMLNQFYALNKDVGYLKKSIEAFEAAVMTFKKVDLTTRVAECHWKIAEEYDTLGEFTKSGETFAEASAAYKKAGQKMPQFSALFQEYARYMEAWSQIEKAKQHHLCGNYALAKECYERTAEIHKSLKRWNYLTNNYFAWSILENAEDLSRKEKSEEAIKNFQRAAEIFDESDTTLKDAIAKIETVEERQLAEELIKATKIRHEYCIGRIFLEEAKMLDKQGDHFLSSKKFGDASKIFKKTALFLENKLEKKDLELIATLAEAWQRMTQAETEMSPILYAEASRLFQQAKNFASDEKTKMLTMGHHHFCKALESGTKFVDAREMATWSIAMQELDSAGNYYMKACFESAFEFTTATRLLFEAYVYIDKAKKELHPEKKTKLYLMTEKVLEASADHFEKAQHPEKRIQARALMKEIEKEKEFALSLTKVLHTPLITSTTSFPVPSPTFESAVGSEQFGYAHIQANLKAQEDIEFGDQLEILFDLVNIGNNYGLLVRLDNIVPSGTKIASVTPQYEVENSSLNLKGKKIDPLKIESIKINLQPTRPGVVSLRPQVVYVDDRGQFRTSRPEPLSVSVHLKTTFEFHTKEAEAVFSYLVNSFVDDYMKRKMPLEKSGWRTLNEIVTHGRIPKSSVYGARGHRGQDISELERRGIVEYRIFSGERGRGGKILKVRIPYDKETIKRYVDERVMKK